MITINKSRTAWWFVDIPERIRDTSDIEKLRVIGLLDRNVWVDKTLPSGHFIIKGEIWKKCNINYSKIK